MVRDKTRRRQQTKANDQNQSKAKVNSQSRIRIMEKSLDGKINSFQLWVLLGSVVKSIYKIQPMKPQINGEIEVGKNKERKKKQKMWLKSMSS